MSGFNDNKGFAQPDFLQNSDQAPAEKLPPQEIEAEQVNSSTAKGVVLDNWRHAKEELDKAKAKEAECKKSVLSHIQEEIVDGTNRFSTKFFTLKVVKTPTYSVNGKDMNALNQALQQIANLSQPEIAMELIGWKPTLNKKVYDNLPPELKAIIDPFVEMKYNSPTFSIEELK